MDVTKRGRLVVAQQSRLGWVHGYRTQVQRLGLARHRPSRAMPKRGQAQYSSRVVETRPSRGQARPSRGQARPSRCQASRQAYQARLWEGHQADVGGYFARIIEQCMPTICVTCMKKCQNDINEMSFFVFFCPSQHVLSP